MTIRRVDRQNNEPGFARFHGAEIGTAEVERFLPNRRALLWTQIEESALSRGEWYAQDGACRVNIHGDPDSILWHEEVMGLYRRFMGGADRAGE